MAAWLSLGFGEGLLLEHHIVELSFKALVLLDILLVAEEILCEHSLRGLE